MSSLRMDNLEQLSDEELRLRLMQCGLPNLPVTSTTRKILIKKLRHYIDAEKQKLRRESSKASRYSSGEDSDTSDGLKKSAAQRKSIAASSSSSTGSSRVGRSQRATVGGGPPLPSLAANSMSMPPPTGRASVKQIPNSSISSPALAGMQHNLGSYSSFAGANGSHSNSVNHNHVGAGSSNVSSSKKASLSPAVGSSVYISPVIVHDSEEEDYPPSLRGTPVGAGGSNRSYGSASPSPTSHSSLFRKTATLNTNITPPSANSSMYSHLNSTAGGGASGAGGGGGSNNSSGLLNDSNGSSNSAAADSSPYISEYTKRLMQLRGETVSQENYNSAISGIIGRRSSGNAGGGGGPTMATMSSRYGGGLSQMFPLRTQQPPPASPMMLGGNHPGGPLHHPVHMRTGGHHLLNSKATGTGGSPSSLGLGTSGSIIAGNHIRQRYSRLQPGGGTGGNSGQYEFNENDIVTHAQPSPDPPAMPFRVAIGNLIAKLDEHYGFKQTFIPCALLCLFVAFLLSVAFMYMTISTDLVSTLSSIDTRYELCDGGGGGDGSTGAYCVQAADVEPALELLKLIGTELKTRVEQHHCRDAATVPGSMSAGEVLKYAKEHSPSVLIPQLTRHLHAMEYLIDRNAQWRIDHCDADGQPISFADVLDRRASKSNHFTILKPKLPFTCMLYNKFQKFFVVVGALTLAGIALLLGNYLVKFVVQVKQRRRDQVNGLISDIIHAVSQAAANASDAANAGGKEPDARVVINHLRDRLLGSANRRKLGWAWDEALHFLEHNESRIMFEIGTMGGEDFRMMRWIDSAPLATSAPGTAAAGGRGAVGGSMGGGASPAGATGGCPKKWQSPAFDNSNKIHDPPTPCLKIRQMFDKYEVNDPNLKTIVQDAILEKVGGRCKIYDIQLDRSSCCVYVRCASAKDAGIVHDEINGWWFDNRLVSIKFLRLERYMQRFPRSAAGPAVLKPSNKNNSSMSHQLHNSGSGRFAGNGGRGGGKPAGNDDQDTDPEEDDDDGEEDEEEDQVDQELAGLAMGRSRTGNNSSRRTTTSAVVAGGRRARVEEEPEDGDEDQENERE